MGDGLLNFEEKDYGDQYKPHLLEQYKLYLAGIEKIGDLRHQTSVSFLIANTVFVCFLVIMSGRMNLLSPDSLLAPVFLILLSLIGVLICSVWGSLLKTYRQLNACRYQSLHQVERLLPVSFFAREWQALGEGKDRAKYTPFSQIESRFPLLFLALYVVMFFTALIGLAVTGR